ncbi:MAG TPA: hypothetical protein VNV60_07240 [Holophagaceae bacterium]|jgi:hypothetical protein|nr:hypothetical protein [Holophagaceae bacterium]
MKRSTCWVSITLVAPLVTLCGCYGPVSYTSERPLPTSEASKDWHTIEVVHIDQIRRDYEIIGECRGDALLSNVIDLKKQAARLGADAITIPKVTDSGYLISQAIRYKSSEEKPAADKKP